jgi:hypothetical protein
MKNLMLKFNIIDVDLAADPPSASFASMQFSAVPATQWQVYEEAGFKKRR